MASEVGTVPRSICLSDSSCGSSGESDAAPGSVAFDDGEKVGNELIDQMLSGDIPDEELYCPEVQDYPEGETLRKTVVQTPSLLKEKRKVHRFRYRGWVSRGSRTGIV